MGTLLFITKHFAMIAVLFIHLILEDVLPGDSKAIGTIGALYNHSYTELYSPEKKKTTTTTTTTTTEKTWPEDVVKHEHFCSLKANSLKTGTKH